MRNIGFKKLGAKGGVYVPTYKFVPGFPTQNLVAYYKLDKANGSVIDSVNGYNGTNYGATPNVQGKLGTAYSFDGVNDYITIPDSDAFSMVNELGNNVNFSISLWVNFNVVGDQWFINKRDASTGDEWQFFYYEGNLIFMIWNQDDTILKSEISNWTPTLNVFHHFVISVDLNDILPIKIYQNSVDITETFTGTIGALKNGTQLVTIGKAGWFNGFYFKGLIDEVGIWKGYALTPQDVSKLWNEGAGLTYTLPYPTQNLVAYYKLDEANGSVIDSVNGYNGTNYGATPNVQGKLGTAYSFDGVNDYIETSLDLSTFTHFTFRAWFKTTDTRLTDNAIFSTCPFSVLGVTYMLTVENGVVFFRFGGNMSFSSAPLNDGVWHRIILLFPTSKISGDVRVFVDNVELSILQITDNIQINTSTNTLKLGVRPEFNGYWYNGELDEVAIDGNYNLTLDEISRDYNDGLGRTI